MAELFGFEIKRKNNVAVDQLPSFTPKENDDGAVEIGRAHV